MKLIGSLEEFEEGGSGEFWEEIEERLMVIAIKSKIKESLFKNIQGHNLRDFLG